MKAVIIDGGEVKVKEMERPKPSKGEVLVKMKITGLCGTDIEKIEGKYTASMQIIGHEPIGIIEDVGEGVDVLKPGDRVFVHHHVPCYECWYCRKGSPTMCPHYRKTNIYPGGFSEYFLVPSWNVERGGIINLSDEISDERGIFIEPLATVIRAYKRLNVEEDDRVLIVGAGPMGLLHMLMLLSKGVNNVFVSDIREYRLSFVEKLGGIAVKEENLNKVIMSETEGRGADIVVVATGNSKAISSGLRLVRRGGKLCIFGVPFKGSYLDYDLADLLSNEISIITSNAASEEDIRISVNLLKEKISAEKLVTHKIPLQYFPEAVKIYKEGRAMKIAIIP